MEALPTRQRVPGRDGGDDVLLEHPFDHEVARIGLGAHEAEIEVAARQLLGLSPDREFAQLQDDPRVGAPEASHRARYHADRRGLDEADREPADHAARRVTGRGHRRVDVIEGAPAVLGQGLAGGGQADRPAAAVDQLDPDYRLELANLLAQRGLRDVQALGRAAEIQLFGHRGEVAQMSQFDVHR